MKKAEFISKVMMPPDRRIPGDSGSRTFSEAAVLTHLDLENNFKSPPFEITLQLYFQ